MSQKIVNNGAKNSFSIRGYDALHYTTSKFKIDDTTGYLVASIYMQGVCDCVSTGT